MASRVPGKLGEAADVLGRDGAGPLESRAGFQSRPRASAAQAPPTEGKQGRRQAALRMSPGMKGQRPAASRPEAGMNRESPAKPKRKIKPLPKASWPRPSKVQSQPGESERRSPRPRAQKPKR